MHNESYKINLLEASRFQDREKLNGSDVFWEPFGAPIGRFVVRFWRPLEFEGGPQNNVFGIEANTMLKNGVIDRVLKKWQIFWDFVRFQKCVFW